jgi:hypothetical protein
MSRIRRRYLDRIFVVLLLVNGFLAVSVLTGCGGGKVTSTHSSQSYNVTITASGGGDQHSVGVTLVVQ